MVKSAKICIEEIVQEINKSQLVEKAYRKLNNCLDEAEKKSDIIAASQVILKYTVGETINNKFTPPTPEEEESIKRTRDGILQSNPC